MLMMDFCHHTGILQVSVSIFNPSFQALVTICRNTLHGEYKQQDMRHREFSQNKSGSILISSLIACFLEATLIQILSS